MNDNVRRKNGNTRDEMNGAYYYHSDHLGSAQVVTNHAGNIYERFEYTPYGEVWIAWANSGVAHNEMLPYRFTGKELDEETGLYYYGARYLDPRVSRWLSADPALGDYLPSAPVNGEARRRNGNLPGMGGVFNYVNLHAYHYAGNNPVRYTDPDGRTDWIYTDGMSDPKKENDWGFWEFLHVDRYFVELENGTRLRANSKETVTLYKEWTKIDKDFLNSTLNKLVNDANNTGDTNFKRIWDESVGGNLDFKNNDPMNNDVLYLANNVLYNRNEAGNFVWAYFLESKGYGGLIPGFLAQGGSLFGNDKNSPRFDELHDVRARHAGQRYYHSLSKQRIRE